MSDTERPTADSTLPANVIGDFSRTARILLVSTDVRDALQHVVDAARTTIDGCDHAGLFFEDGGSISLRVYTDDVAENIDDLQHRLGEGPCLDALAGENVFYAEDLLDDDRWPAFGPEASARGVRSALALHISAAEVNGALNLYARYPRAFGVIDRGNALILSTLAGISIAVAQEHEDEQRRVDGLYAALATREVIGQAQGILMERERVTADEAFDILRRASQHLNRKLREVAQDLVETGERPETGSAGGQPAH